MCCLGMGREECVDGGCARCLPVAIMDMVALGGASSGYGYVLGGRWALLQKFLYAWEVTSVPVAGGEQ